MATGQGRRGRVGRVSLVPLLSFPARHYPNGDAGRDVVHIPFFFLDVCSKYSILLADPLTDVLHHES